MRIYISFGWHDTAIADVSAAELDVFMKVVDKMLPCDSNYSSNGDIQLNNKPLSIDVRMLRGNVKVLAPVIEVPVHTTDAEAA